MARMSEAKNTKPISRKKSSTAPKRVRRKASTAEAAPKPKRATKARPAAKKKTTRTTAAAATIRHAMVAEAAYFRAQSRGFAPGHDLEDWLAAERQIDALQIS